MPKVINAGMAIGVSSCTVVPPRGVCLTRVLGLKGTICLEDLAQMIQTFTLVHEQLGVFNTPLLPQRAV